MAAVYLHILKSELPLKGKSLTPTIGDSRRCKKSHERRIHVRGIYLQFCTYGNPPFAIGNVLRLALRGYSFASLPQASSFALAFSVALLPHALCLTLAYSVPSLPPAWQYMLTSRSRAFSALRSRTFFEKKCVAIDLECSETQRNAIKDLQL